MFTSRKHPYFDPKSNEGTPTWYMVNVKFVERLPHPPTLALIKVLAALPSSALPEEISYIGEDGLKAIAGMQLVNRGRLSVQPVEEAAYEAICLLGTKGGFEPLLALSSPSSSASASASAKKGKSATSKTKAAPTRTSQTSAASALAANKAAKSLPTNDDDVSAAIARENTIYPGTTTDRKNGKISDGELTPPPLLGDEGEATAKTNKVVTPRKRKNANAKTSASSNDRLDRGAKDETGTKSEVKPEPERHGRVGERRSKRLKA
ncbi:hypothetical protein I316_02391 [Kwoniella heveanensis BCC8398]|uniref:EVE domain-containing protein n=1 Tax=Kwoniella heveanensis BCC8398 TaxID=1296120 RepID=A0A1B9GXY5_9TREE|nr:hypothetical protein I316_02391 [Kwoniella heveanensis BCC8398]